MLNMIDKSMETESELNLAAKSLSASLNLLNFLANVNGNAMAIDGKVTHGPYQVFFSVKFYFYFLKFHIMHSKIFPDDIISLKINLRML